MLQSKNLNRLLKQRTMLTNKYEILCHTSVAVGQEIFSQVFLLLRIIESFSQNGHRRPIGVNVTSFSNQGRKRAVERVKNGPYITRVSSRCPKLDGKT